VFIILHNALCLSGWVITEVDKRYFNNSALPMLIFAVISNGAMATPTAIFLLQETRAGFLHPGEFS